MAGRIVACLVLALPLTATGAITARAADASSAGAASTAVQATGTVAAGGPVEVQIWPGQNGQTVVISTVSVPTSTPLPATVRIPLVAGTTVEWSGEVLGGDPANDIAAQHTISEGVGGQYVEFRLTKSRQGQIDTIGLPLSARGDVVSVQIDWVQSVASAKTGFSVRIPVNVYDVGIQPAPVGQPLVNSAGESLYALNEVTLKPGEKQTISISYNIGAPKAATPQQQATPWLIGLGLALAAAVGWLAWMLRRQQVASVPIDEGEEFEADEDDGEGEEPA